ncbi:MULTISPECIES: hypothetical protein [unclassified Pantoea]|uniref:hypothetical protein n=1 Tax=unclassified Pantoea TaxID=2630326 RepID=UPI0005354DB3|nr:MULTISPECIES: hypothetical protein [unclassified Pantoea]MDU6387258.1 hypothetical protein [Pantoea sp.]
MPKNSPSQVLTQKEMQRLALVHLQAYVGACHCQSRSDVLLALTHWQNVGDEVADFIRTTRIVVVNEHGAYEF